MVQYEQKLFIVEKTTIKQNFFIALNSYLKVSKQKKTSFSQTLIRKLLNKHNVTKLLNKEHLLCCLLLKEVYSFFV